MESLARENSQKSVHICSPVIANSIQVDLVSETQGTACVQFGTYFYHHRSEPFEFVRCILNF